jgi:hypothetical protein
MPLEFQDYFLVETVAALGTAERDRRDRTVFLDEEV